MNKILIFIIVVVSIVIGYLIPIPSPIETQEPEIHVKRSYVNAPPIKKEQIIYDIEELFLIDNLIENEE